MLHLALSTFKTVLFVALSCLDDQILVLSLQNLTVYA